MEESLLNEIIEIQLQGIAMFERIKELLTLRLSLIGEGKATKSEFELNELEIMKMETHAKINKIDKELFIRKTDFNESFARYIEELEFEDKNIE